MRSARPRMSATMILLPMPFILAKEASALMGGIWRKWREITSAAAGGEASLPRPGPRLASGVELRPVDQRLAPLRAEGSLQEATAAVELQLQLQQDLAQLACRPKRLLLRRAMKRQDAVALAEEAHLHGLRRLDLQAGKPRPVPEIGI